MHSLQASPCINKGFLIVVVVLFLVVRSTGICIRGIVNGIVNIIDANVIVYEEEDKVCVKEISRIIKFVLLS